MIFPGSFSYITTHVIVVPQVVNMNIFLNLNDLILFYNKSVTGCGFALIWALIGLKLESLIDKYTCWVLNRKL